MNTAAAATERQVAIDDLDDAIVNLSARINAATYELLVLIRQFDERAGFLRWGLTNCTQWLHWRCDLSLSAAREKVRVAHALKNLPAISAAFATGKLSYSKVRALSRVATVYNEPSLLDFAMTTTAARVEERCRQMRNVLPQSVADAKGVQQNKSLQCWRNADRGTMTITVELPIEEGELVSQALDKAVENHAANGPEFESQSFSAQQAEALVDIARLHLSGSAGSGFGSGPDAHTATADHYQVIIHVDQDALTKGQGRSDLPVESVRRLSCDGSLVSIVETGDGEPIRLGRKQRKVSPALRRALWARDRGCRFPGCGHTRFVDAHHIRHWSKGGETNLDNLILLCSRHHQLVHEGGYEIRHDEQGRRYFRRPDGRAVPAHGYQPADMTDDYLDGASAEVFSEWTGSRQLNGVREPSINYLVQKKTASAEGFPYWMIRERVLSTRSRHSPVHRFDP